MLPRTERAVKTIMSILFASILLAVAFAPSSTQQTSEYDPWADYNGDGVIDIDDVIAPALAFARTRRPNQKRDNNKLAVRRTRKLKS